MVIIYNSSTSFYRKVAQQTKEKMHTTPTCAILIMKVIYYSNDRKRVQRKTNRFKIKDYLKFFEAISIEEPKWCGKTWTAKNHSNSAVFLDDSSENFDNRTEAKMDVSLIIDKEVSKLIDEWGRSLKYGTL